jgi:hypothetical protein
VEIPLTYPYDDFAVLARALELPRNKGPVWAMRTEGVLAIDRALTLSKPCLVRLISVGVTSAILLGNIMAPIFDEAVFGIRMRRLKLEG